MLLRLIHLNCRQYRSLLISNNLNSLKRIQCNFSSSSNRNSEAELIDSGSVVCNAKMSFQAGEGDMSKLLSLAQKFNCFYLSGLALEECRPFVVEGFQVGLIRPDFLKELLNYPEVFNVTSGYVELNPAFRNYDERSTKVDAVLRKLRSEKKFITLKGWRNECYDVKREFVSSSFLKMDRCATCLFGIRNYGVDINGYVKHPTLGLCLWVQQRSATKQTWPGKWDNMVGGGLSVGHGILETAYKESQEEASIPIDITKNLVSAGCVSFFFESERGLFPNTVFVYDLELPLEFIPINADGEVEKFELLPASVCLERICTADFKTTSAPVVLDFMIRHGVVTVENEKALTRIVELLHVPLQTIYKNHLTPNHVKTKENGTTNANI